MKVAWKKGYKRGSDELKDLEAAYAASSLIRRRLVEMLQEMYDLETKARIQSNSYDSPAWAYQQADTIGYARAIDKIIKLLEDTPEKD